MTVGLKLKGVRHGATSHNIRFPNEDDATRKARNALLREEIELRRHVETVAAQRRALPAGPPIKENYVLNRGSGSEIRFSDLFDGTRSLVTYNMMFGRSANAPALPAARCSTASTARFVILSSARDSWCWRSRRSNA